MYVCHVLLILSWFISLPELELMMMINPCATTVGINSCPINNSRFGYELRCTGEDSDAVGFLKDLFKAGCTLGAMKLKRISEESLSDVLQMTDIQNVLRLELHNTTCAQVTSKWFRHLPNLKELSVRNCDMKTISEDAFQGLSSLQSLELDSVELTAIPVAINDLKGLVSLNIIRNPLFIISTSIELPKLQKLQLNYNSIEGVTERFVTNCSSLKSLHMIQNRLKSFKNILLPGSVTELILDHNSFPGDDGISFLGDYAHLERISLRFCDLTTIPSAIFKKTKGLKELHLSFNNISKIGDDAFGENPPEILGLIGTNLSCDCNLARTKPHLLKTDRPNKCWYSREKSFITHQNFINICKNSEEIDTIREYAKETTKCLDSYNSQMKENQTGDDILFQKNTDLSISDVAYTTGSQAHNSVCTKPDGFRLEKYDCVAFCESGRGLTVTCSGLSADPLCFLNLLSKLGLFAKVLRLTEISKGKVESCLGSNYVKQLESLALTSCDCEKIPPSWFSKTLLLTDLDIQSCNLRRRINLDTFSKLQELQILRMQNVNMTRFPYAVTRLKNLKQLHLGHNKIKFVHRRINMPSLVMLFLYYNEIENVTVNAFSSCTNLGLINLSYNRLKRWHLNCTAKLKKLSLSYNKLLVSEPIAFSESCHSLEELELKGIGLQQVRQSFLPLQKLTKLSLDENLITYLSKSSFQRIPTLIHLLGNPLVCNCTMKWLVNHLDDTEKKSLDCTIVGNTELKMNFVEFINLYGMDCENDTTPGNLTSSEPPTTTLESTTEDTAISNKPTTTTTATISTTTSTDSSGTTSSEKDQVTESSVPTNDTTGIPTSTVVSSTTEETVTSVENVTKTPSCKVLDILNKAVSKSFDKETILWDLENSSITDIVLVTKNFDNELSSFILASPSKGSYDLQAHETMACVALANASNYVSVDRCVVRANRKFPLVYVLASTGTVVAGTIVFLVLGYRVKVCTERKKKSKTKVYVPDRPPWTMPQEGSLRSKIALWPQRLSVPSLYSGSLKWKLRSFQHRRKKIFPPFIRSMSALGRGNNISVIPMPQEIIAKETTDFENSYET